MTVFVHGFVKRAGSGYEGSDKFMRNSVIQNQFPYLLSDNILQICRLLSDDE